MIGVLVGSIRIAILVWIAVKVVKFLEGGTVPTATRVDTTEDFNLKSLPEGVVTLRRMTYGDKMARQQMASEMSIGSGKSASATVKMMNEKITLFDYARCIVSHNLTDENETPLDFSRASDVRRLDPRVGEEIELLIDKMNNFEEEDEANSEGNS